MKLGLTLLATFAFCIGAPAAHAQIEPASDGMFLCGSPALAMSFWFDLNAAATAGVRLNRSIAANVAAKHQCRFVRSNKLRPVRFVSGQLGITDGSGLGWAAPELYIIYLNNPPG